MRVKHLLAAAAALSMAGAPVAASAANPAQSLSVADVRTGSATAGDNELRGNNGGGGIFALLIVAGIAAIVIIAAVNGDDDDPDSP